MGPVIQRKVIKMKDENGQSVATPVGESAAEQAAPMSIVARERMIEIIANNTKVIADCNEIVAILNERPDLDASFCRLFGITRTPGIRDVSK